MTLRYSASIIFSIVPVLYGTLILEARAQTPPKTVPKSIVSTLFEEAGVSKLQREATDATDLAAPAIFAKRDAAYEDYAKKVDSVLKRDGLDVTLTNIEEGDTFPTSVPVLKLRLRVSGCGTGFESVIYKDAQAVEGLSSFPRDAPVKIKRSVAKTAGGLTGNLILNLTRISRPDDTPIVIRPYLKTESEKLRDKERGEEYMRCQALGGSSWSCARQLR